MLETIKNKLGLGEVLEPDPDDDLDDSVDSPEDELLYDGEAVAFAPFNADDFRVETQKEEIEVD